MRELMRDKLRDKLRKNMRDETRDGEGGYIVVESITTFILFVLLMLSILTLVNIVTVQARMHYALTQSADTLSMYSYTLEVTGAASAAMGVPRAGSKPSKGTIESVIDGILSLQGDSGTFSRADYIWVDDPVSAVGLVLGHWMDANFGESLLRPLVGRYLSNGDQSGDEFLKSFNVEGGIGDLDFTGSKFLDSNGNVSLTVKYNIQYKFGALPLPFPSPRLKVTQTVKTKAWLHGSGKGYW